MFDLLFRLFPLIAQPMLAADDGGGGGGGKGADDSDDQDDANDRDGDQRDADDDGDDEPLGKSGRKALALERQRATDEEKKRKDAERRLAAIEKKQRDADEAAAKEQGNFKELYEKLQEDHKQLQTDREKERIQTFREKSARTEGIPDDLVNRIEGDDEATIAADAKKLAQYLKGRDAPDLDAGDKGGGGGKKNGKKDEAKYKDPSYWVN